MMLDLKPAFVLQMRSKDTLGALKRRVGEHVSKSPDLLKVIVGDTKEFKHDEKTFFGKAHQ